MAASAPANPFAAAAGTGNPFAAAAAAPAAAAANPFAAAAAPATAAANPFAAAAAPAAAANPFASAAGATTATSAGNPFAAAATTTTAANPFAAATTAAAANPFAAAATTAASPFAVTTTTTTATANPFAAAAAGTTAAAGAVPTHHVSEQLVNDFKALQQAYVPNLATPAALERYTRFKYIVYNLRNPHVDRYVKPPELSQRQWEQALKEAPEPYSMLGADLDDDVGSEETKRARAADRLVPVAVLGFKGLKQRMQQQDKDISQFREFAQTLAVSVKQVERDALAAETKIENLRQQHTVLSHRLIQVMEKVDRVLARGKPLDKNEVQLRNRLEGLVERLNRPTEFKARLNELMSTDRMHGDARAGGRREQFGDDDLRQVLMRLEAQRVGLAHLNTIVKTDARDLSIMARPNRALDAAGAGAASGSSGYSGGYSGGVARHGAGWRGGIHGIHAPDGGRRLQAGRLGTSAGRSLGTSAGRSGLDAQLGVPAMAMGSVTSYGYSAGRRYR